MLLRSKSAATTDEPFPQAPLPANIKARSKRKAQFVDASDASQTSKDVDELCQTHYGYSARPKQRTPVVDLLNGLTAFLLAGTGFGKSRVPELFYHAHDPKFQPIILCINPLEGLGNDQVSMSLLLPNLSHTAADN